MANDDVLSFTPDGITITSDLRIKVESELACRLPDDLVQAYISPPALSYPNQFKFINSTMSGSIAHIVPFIHLPEEYYAFSKTYAIEGLLPFAHDAGRNFILIDIAQNSPSFGSIYFYECDFNTPSLIATSMKTFLAGIQCFSLDEIDFDENGNILVSRIIKTQQL